MKEKNATNIVY